MKLHFFIFFILQSHCIVSSSAPKKDFIIEQLTNSQIKTYDKVWHQSDISVEDKIIKAGIIHDHYVVENKINAAKIGLTLQKYIEQQDLLSPQEDSVENEVFEEAPIIRHIKKPSSRKRAKRRSRSLPIPERQSPFDPILELDEDLAAIEQKK